MDHKIVDHLFRHQYGKMVAILSKKYGLHQIDLIEDSVQDAFINATLSWREKLPENPKGWLYKASHNRLIDLLRKEKATREREERYHNSNSTDEISWDDPTLEHEIADSQLRMIFVASHPILSTEEQIAFALKTISGFSMKEVAAALMQKDETIKKRLSRARKKIQQKNIQLTYPAPAEIDGRMATVLQVIYLIFNEGFHSTKPERLISKDLCGEALRLCKQLLIKERFRSGSLYALFSLCCFHSSRLESKINAENEIVDLKRQDRSKWYQPLIQLGHNALKKTEAFDDISAYHYEAAIAAEHVRAITFDNTDWNKIIALYEAMHEFQPNDSTLLNLATIALQQDHLDLAEYHLSKIDPGSLGRREYLLRGAFADLCWKRDAYDQAIKELSIAIELCSNALEKDYLIRKMKIYLATHS